MKNIKFSVLAVVVIIFSSYNEVKSQVSTLGHFSVDPTNYSGWNSAVTFPFQVRHDGNQPILFSTNATERMGLMRYGNLGVGTTIGIRPKFMSWLNNTNASILESGPFFSMAIYGENSYDLEGWQDHFAVVGRCNGVNTEPGQNNNGGRFEAYNSWRNVGVNSFTGNMMNPIGGYVGEIGWSVLSLARNHSASNIGIVARATYGTTPGPFTEIVGISAGIDGAVGNPTEFAGAFQGDVQVWGNVTADGYFLNPSDVQFKTNIQSIDSALAIINALQPKKYEFLNEQFAHLNFPEGEQFGVIAQELNDVLPNLVKESRMLTAYDTLGNVTAEPIDFLAVHYDGIIPILIAGMQEQQSIIESQNEALAGVMDQLNALQSQVDNCCNGGTGFKNTGAGGAEEEQMQKASPHGNVLNQNTPNPFRSQTTISYTLEQGGKVLLNIFDKTGKPITTLVEAEQAADTYRYEWDATGLPAGLYHYALYVDGELLVKKAIKLAD